MTTIYDYFGDHTPSDVLRAYITHCEEGDQAEMDVYRGIQDLRAQVGVTWSGDIPEDYPDREAIIEKWDAINKERSEVNKRYRESRKPYENAVSKEEMNLLYAARKRYYCRAGTETKAAEYSSPTGKYKLVVTHHQTRLGAWNYTKGLVYRGDDLVAEVLRNYASFDFAWAENHPNGHDYMLCGEDYQGQTVLELDTGERRDFLPDAAEEGFGFCFASYEFSPDLRVLAVDGCYWAAPYELRFYDFSDPLAGPLPLLHVEHDSAPGAEPPGWVSDNTYKYSLYQRDEEGGWIPNPEYDKSREKDKTYGVCKYLTKDVMKSFWGPQPPDYLAAFKGLLTNFSQNITWEDILGLAEHSTLIKADTEGLLCRMTSEQVEAAQSFVMARYVPAEE